MLRLSDNLTEFNLIHKSQVEFDHLIKPWISLNPPPRVNLVFSVICTDFCYNRLRYRGDYYDPDTT